jgi:hypothetical protein
MKKYYLHLFFSMAVHSAVYAQTKVGVELYNYINAKPSFQPIAYLQTRDHWYAECRYNYEDEKTFALYAGKTFSGGNKIEYDFTPMIGFSTGGFTGVSFASNMSAKWKNFFGSSQSQYSINLRKRDSAAIKANRGNFFFSWSEIEYSVSDHFFTGLAAQCTLQTGLYEFKPGVVIGVQFGKIQIPFYVFSPFEQSRYFILGFIFEIDQKEKK